MGFWIFCLLLSGMNSLYIIDNNPLLDIWFVNIFFNSTGYLFILCILSFVVHKPSNIYSCLFILYFFCLFLASYLKKSLPMPMSGSFFFSSMLSSRNFMVSHHTLTSVIYFELIFLYGVR